MKRSLLDEGYALSASILTLEKDLQCLAAEVGCGVRRSRHCGLGRQFLVEAYETSMSTIRRALGRCGQRRLRYYSCNVLNRGPDRS